MNRGGPDGGGRPARLDPDTIPAAIFEMRVDGTVVYMNETARHLDEGAELTGRAWLELWPGVGSEAWERLLTSGVPLHHEGAIGERTLSFTLVQDTSSGRLLAYGSDVTELRQAKEVLAEQALELRENAMFPEMNPGPVCRLDLQGTVLRANRAALELFGEELIGSRWQELVPAVTEDAWRRIVHEELRFWVEAAIADKRLGFTMARGPDSPYVYVYGADITALKAAESTVQEMALFPEMNPGPVLRLDADGVILLANRAARALFPATELLGRRWTELCPDVPGRLLQRTLTNGETVGHEVELGGRQLLFTYAPGFGGEHVFVYGADLTDLKDVERALRQSERMATLGTLAAGVAHELNNPAAAVQRAAEHLGNTLGALQSAQLGLHRLVLEPGAVELLGELEGRARERAASPPDFDPVTRSDHENDVELWLEDQGIDDAWDLAPSLVGLGYRPSELDDLAQLLPSEHLAPVVLWMSRTYPAYAVLEEIRHGAGRIAQIVTALKAYSYVDRAPLQAVDVNEGLRHTLIILQHKLKRGIAVELDLDPELPAIEAYGGDLNQVWTNLIDNAVDAMAGEGRLVLRSTVEDGWIRVEVEDDGPGIPPDIQGRIFDPFFTTKDPGQGTGLGLNTTFTIVVKKHGGRIELQSEPGCTRFVVGLPRLLGADRPQSDDRADRGVA